MPLIRIDLADPSTRGRIPVVILMFVKVIIVVEAGIDVWNFPNVHVVIVIQLVFPLASDLIFMGLLSLLHLVVALCLIHTILVLDLLLQLLLSGAPYKVLFLLSFVTLF